MGLGFQWFDLSWLPLRYMSGVTVTVPVIVVVLSLSGARGAAPSVMIVLSAVLYALMLGLGTAVAAALLGGIPLVVLQWSAEGPRAAVMGTAVTVVALVMSWAAGGLRRASETAARQAAEALAAAAQAEAQVQAEREQRERDKAAEAARALVEREQKVTQLVERITRLSQSGDNTDRITRTLDAVRTQVGASVSSVATILESMGELARYNGTLTAALEEQGAVVNNVVQSVTATARATAAMADDITALRVLAVE